MSIQTEVNRIKSNISSTYTNLQNMGETMPSTKNSANLANTVAAIKPATKKSVTIEASAWAAETGGLVATCTVTGDNSASAVDVLPSQALYSWMVTNTVEAMLV